MKYTKALDDLDRRTGKVHTMRDWAALGEKPPEAISDDDLIVIETFAGPASAERARQDRHKAIYGDGYPAPALPPAAAPAPAAAPETIAEFVERYGDKTVTYQALAGAWDPFIDVLAQHKQKIDALTQSNKALADRILELEAQRAAVDHVEQR